MSSISQRIILNIHITILPMLLAGEFSHTVEAGFKGVFYGFGLWAVKMLWVWIMGGILVLGLLHICH
jgi:hypothetical protein